MFQRLKGITQQLFFLLLAYLLASMLLDQYFNRADWNATIQTGRPALSYSQAKNNQIQ